ncbi:MAG: hypothetical protein H6704_15205 [Myxococcales bacterium]|nr:hypothetical protein [Myxococcales bacterium]
MRWCGIRLAIATAVALVGGVAFAAPSLEVKSDGGDLLLVVSGGSAIDPGRVRTSWRNELAKITVPGVRLKKQTLEDLPAWVAAAKVFPDAKANMSYLRVRLAEAPSAEARERLRGEAAADGVIIRVPGPAGAASPAVAVAPAVAPAPAVVPAPVAPPAPVASPAPAEPVAKAPAPPPAAAAPPSPAGNTVKVSVPTVGGSVREEVGALATALYDAIEKRPGLHRVAVMPFQPLDPESADLHLGEITAELMRTRTEGRPRLLQVERARLDDVVGELKRSDRGELSPDSAASVGKLLGASEVVVGSVAQAGAEFVLTARAVDAETGQVIAAAEQTLPKADTIELSQDLLEVKSKWGAAARSAVLPGWGQVYNGDTGRGIVYGAVFAAVAAGAVASAVLGANAEDSYNENTPDTVDDRSTANDHYQRANWLLVGMGAVWAINIVDAYLTGTNAELVKVSGSAGVGGAQLGLGFTF